MHSGCGTLPVRNPVPLELLHEAQVPGIPDARVLNVFFGDPIPESLINGVVARAKTLDRPISLLAISGGGARGAFGAGVLYGWSKAGTRPEFDIVTGVSTGALISPFAFIGADYDEDLHKSYTSMSDEDIYKRRGIFAILRRRDAVADDAPLRAYIDAAITPELLAAVAKAHEQGRRLFVGTTHMDAQMLSIWNMGAIAASGHPNAHRVFCDVLLASASIPVTFPPKYFTVEAGGEQFDEMHCDGGVSTQVFGAALLAEVVERSSGKDGRLFVIRNGVQMPEWLEVRPTILGIATRSTSSLIKAQSYGDMYRMYLVAKEDNLDFNLAIIPESFSQKPNSEFDQAYMQALFDLGRAMAFEGRAWQKAPPGHLPLATAGN